MKRVGDEATIELGFGSTAYIELGMAGFFGLLPATSWLFSLGIGLFGESKTSSSGVLGLLAVVVTILGILAAPWALPAVLLRARQWSGARIAIEEDAVVEYDGAWRRTVIPWVDATYAFREWKVSNRNFSQRGVAVQARDRRTGAVITVWTVPLDDSLPIRRRLVGANAKALESALKARRVPLEGDVDSRSAADPERPMRPSYVRMMGRLGYAAGFMAPLVVAATPVWGALAAVASAALLTLRAEPVFRELVTLRAKLRAAMQPPASDMPAIANADPYRAMQAKRTEIDPAEIAARRAKLRAVFAEALTRSLFVVLTIASTVVAWSVQRQ